MPLPCKEWWFWENKHEYYTVVLRWVADQKSEVGVMNCLLAPKHIVQNMFLSTLWVLTHWVVVQLPYMEAIRNVVSNFRHIYINGADSLMAWPRFSKRTTCLMNWPYDLRQTQWASHCNVFWPIYRTRKIYTESVPCRTALLLISSRRLALSPSKWWPIFNLRIQDVWNFIQPFVEWPVCRVLGCIRSWTNRS